MASTADGRATIDGRSGPIGNRADSALLHGLRTIADALLIGAGTARAEHYARVLRGEEDRQARRQRGISEELRTCIVTASLDLDPRTVPLLDEPAASVTVLTPEQDDLEQSRARVDYLRTGRGSLDLPATLHLLRATHGVDILLCEGGPHLAAQLFAAGMVDELFLCIAPKLGGGEEHLRIFAGAELQTPIDMELLALYEDGGYLFARYGLGGRGVPTASSSSE